MGFVSLSLSHTLICPHDVACTVMTYEPVLSFAVVMYQGMCSAVSALHIRGKPLNVRFALSMTSGLQLSCEMRSDMT